MKIHHKLFFILFGFSLLLVSSLVLLVQWSIDKGMIDYVNSRELEALTPLINELAIIYQKDESWQSLLGEQRKFQRMLIEHLSDSDFYLAKGPLTRRNFPPPSYDSTKHRTVKPSGRPKPRHKPPKKRNAQGRKGPPRSAFAGNKPPPPPRIVSYALLDTKQQLVVGHYSADVEYILAEVIVNKQVVGHFAISKRNQLTQGYDLDFIEQQKHYLWLAAIVVMLFVTIVTMPLAKHLVTPIKQLTRGLYRLTQGNYQQTLDQQRKDEFGQLNRDYNELAKTLANNEDARKRWLANISHELRTPIAILRGELEAMIDGVRAINKDNILSASSEVLHLQRLVEDLHQLTSADIGGMSYRKSEFDLIKLLQQETLKYSQYLASTNSTFSTSIPNEKHIIFADSTRICQLLDNIVNNCVKYAKEQCLVNLSVNVDNNSQTVSIVIEDNGPGVDKQHYQHLFEHLYRTDDSRNRSTGGSGLGLSICAHIVEAHQGKIIAKQSTLGGLAIIITLPLIK